MSNTVFVVIRTLTVDIQASATLCPRSVDAMPVVEGVFTSYDAANDFVDPLLDDKADYVNYSIIERELR